MTDDRSAALLVRVWLEDGDRFRARLTAVGPDAAETEQTVGLASSPSDVVDAVSHWLDQFLRHGPTTD
ncbi:hypothetical protein ACI78V_09520 [Geodermatophilus sp. SYSU D00742]